MLARRIGAQLAMLIMEAQEKYNQFVIFYRTGQLAYVTSKVWDQVSASFIFRSFYHFLFYSCFYFEYIHNFYNFCNLLCTIVWQSIVDNEAVESMEEDSNGESSHIQQLLRQPQPAWRHVEGAKNYTWIKKSFSVCFWIKFHIIMKIRWCCQQLITQDN